MSSSFSYRLLLAAGIAWGTATAQLSLMAILWRAAGQGDQAIANASAMASLAILAGSLAAGPAIERFGARRVLLGGAAIAFWGLCLLPAAVASPALSALTRGLQGLGFGLAITAGILYAKACAAEDDQIRAVGMFTACFMIPTLFAPALGEWLLRHYGQVSFFATAAAAMGIAWVLIAGLRQTDTPPPSDSTGYLRLLRDRRVRLANAAVAISGLGYGFANAFLPLMLAERSVAVGWYFAPFAASLLFTRFVGLSILQRLPAAPLAAIGVAAVGTALALLTVPLVFLAGIFMGLGYAVIHPTTVEWSSQLYPPAERVRPVVLINTSFHAGTIVAVQATGAALPAIGWFGVLVILDTVVTAVFLCVAARAVTGALRLQ